MKKIFTLGIFLFVFGCTSNTIQSANDYDLKDCKQTIVAVSQLTTSGRAPNYINLVTTSGAIIDLGISQDVTGTATYKICKAYYKDTTLYVGEVTILEKINLESN